MSSNEYAPVQRAVADPYPASEAEIAHVRFDSGLHLMRPRNAAQLYRFGEDAEYIVARDFRLSYRLADEESYREIVVPAGMLTDLASVPRLMRVFVGRVGLHLEPAIVHDYLYIAWQAVEGKAPSSKDRSFGDRLMFAAMKEAGVHWFHCHAMYLAIRLMGGGLFKGRNERMFVNMDDPEFQD